MTAWTGAAAAHLAARNPFVLRWLLWLEPKTFAGVVTPMGLWTGETDETITVDGQARLYYGAQGGMEVSPIHYRTGTQIGSLDLRLSLTPEGENFARGFDTRLAPALLHAGIWHPDTGALLGTRRYWKGQVDAASIDTGKQEGVSSIALRLVTAARLGTLSTAGKKSDQSQRQRDPADRFRQYGDLGTKPNDPWGTQGE